MCCGIKRHFFLSVFRDMPAAKATRGWGFIGGLLIFSALMACSTDPSHPPTFADFRRAFREDAHTNFEARVAVFASAQLSKKELQQRFLTRLQRPARQGAACASRRTVAHCASGLGCAGLP